MLPDGALFTEDGVPIPVVIVADLRAMADWLPPRPQRQVMPGRESHLLLPRITGISNSFISLQIYQSPFPLFSHLLDCC